MIAHVTDVRTWGLYSMLVACFGLGHDDCTCYRCWYMGNIHYACSMFRISTWRLYLLQVLIHGYGTSNAQFACYRCEYIVLVLVVQLHVIGLVQSFLIVIVNIECNIIVLIVRDSLFQFGLFMLNLFLLVSAEFNFSLFLCMIVIYSEFDRKICSSLTVCS